MPCTLTAELLISVDGWAGSDDLPAFFGYLGPELEAWMATESSRPHVAIMGRKTYELMADLPDEAKDAEWEKMTRQETVVFSRTLDTVEWPAGRVAGDLIAEITELRASSDVELRTVGSISIIRQLLSAGLIDRLRLVTFPLVAGPSGKEWAYTELASTDLQLAEYHVLDNRVLVVEYRPSGRDIPRS